jgi:hypothetical protein
MSAYVHFAPRGRDPFQVDYPYYGLFGSAKVTPLQQQEQIYECRLLNGHTLTLKKIEKRWIDTVLNHETPLASVIGMSIDDFLKRY